MKCPTCGNTITPNDQFCGKCGKSISQQPAGPTSKIPLLSQLSHKQLLVAGGGLIGLIIIIALLLTILPAKGKRQPVPKPTGLGDELTTEQLRRNGEEIGPNAIYGKVVSMQRGVITIQSLNTGKAYTVYVGRRTYYHPRRYPSVGEKIKVLYIYDRGYMKATQVQIQQ
jgi:hypothetical protein